MHEASDPHFRRKHKSCRRYNEPGHAHALNFSCFHGLPLLSRDRTRSWLLDAIAQARNQHQFHVWAYVVMPEHAHLVIWPEREMYDIGAILSSIKQPVSKRALAFLRLYAPSFLAKLEDRQPNGKVHHRFWQRGGGYDRNLYTPRDVWEKIDYVHRNPVRRELVKHPGEWNWTSYQSHEASANSDRVGLRIDFESLPPRPLK